MAGFDPARARFSTYARHYAEKYMRAAALGHDWEPPQHLQDKAPEFRQWAATPIPPEIELACAKNPEQRNSEIEEMFDALGPQVERSWDGDQGTDKGPDLVSAQSWHEQYRYHPWHQYAPRYFRDPHHMYAPNPVAPLAPRFGVRDPRYQYSEADNPNCFCISRTNFGYLAYWQEGYFVYAFRDTKEAKKRNYPTTALERENRSKWYEKYGYKLCTFDRVAEDGIGGWEGEGFDSNAPEDDAAGESLFGVYNGDDEWAPCAPSPQFGTPSGKFIPKKAQKCAISLPQPYRPYIFSEGRRTPGPLATAIPPPSPDETPGRPLPSKDHRAGT